MWWLYPTPRWHRRVHSVVHNQEQLLLHMAQASLTSWRHSRSQGASGAGLKKLTELMKVQCTVTADNTIQHMQHC